MGGNISPLFAFAKNGPKCNTIWDSVIEIIGESVRNGENKATESQKIYRKM